MNTSRLPNQKQPLSLSLASLRSAAAVVAALLAASPSARAQSTWDGNTLPTPGDGLLWTDPLNWSGDALPGGADVIFANALAGVGTIFLNGDQSANSLTFTESDTLGAYGTNNFLNNLSGAVTVTSGDFATINASYGGTNGIILSGGGTLFLNNPFPTYTGNITVDGVGTTLLHRQEGPGVQYNGINSAQEFGREVGAREHGKDFPESTGRVPPLRRLASRPRRERDSFSTCSTVAPGCPVMGLRHPRGALGLQGGAL